MTTPTPLVTVLITTYNYGRFIEQAIDSVLSQDYPLDKVQILVVDDGSTDDTAERVKKYGSRIDYFQKPNGGQASALNLGIEKSQGEIVMLLDADDVFLPGKLARVADAFCHDPAPGMVYHPYTDWDERTNERRDQLWPLISGDARKQPRQFFQFTPQPTSCIAFRRSDLAPLLPIPQHILMLADCFLVYLVPLLSPVVALPERLILHRIHGTNYFCVDEKQAGVETQRRKLHEWQIVYDAMRRWLESNGYTRKDFIVRRYRDVWYLAEQTISFSIKPPGRLQFFWYELRQNHSQSPIQSWRLTTFKYLFAFFALGLGYKRAERFYDWRARVFGGLERAIRFLAPLRRNSI